MARPKSLFTKSQCNIYLRDDYRKILDQLALAESDKRQVTVTAGDLIREATVKVYKLDRRYGDAPTFVND